MNKLQVSRSVVRTLLTALLALGFGAQAQDEHISFLPDQIQWQPGPGSLPAGAQFAVLEGDPSQEGPLTLRLKFPAQYEIPAHYHSALEHVTVLSGTFYMGMGDELDRAQGAALPTGGFMAIPVGTHHFAWTEDEEVIIQLHSNGPFTSTYVDPADDPRNAGVESRQQALAAPSDEEEIRQEKHLARIAAIEQERAEQVARRR